MSKQALAGAVALLLASTAFARAEVDAQTIWSDWQDTFSRFGGTLSAASQDYSGGTLTLRDVTATTDMGGASTASGYGTITMIEQPDGTVRIELPAEFESTQEVTIDDEKQVQTLSVANDGLSIVASEEAGVRTYDMSAASVAATIDTQSEEDAPPSVTTVTLTDVASTYRSGMEGKPDAFAQTFTAQGLNMSVRADAEDDGQVVVEYDATGLSGDAAGTYGPVRSGPLASLSDLGLTYDATYRHSGSTLKVEGEGEAGPFSANGSSASGEASFAMTDRSLTYAIRSDDAAMTVAAPNLPVPVEVSLAEISSSTTVPMGAPDGVQPFSATLALRELAIDDAIWGLFDPTGQLPRDPATLSLDMDGTAEMKVDLFGDPEVLQTIEDSPGDVKTLNLKDLTIDFAGALLKGTGALTFPEPKPVPEPVGKIELSLDGGFALVDKFVALGFIPAEQGAFFKGMAGAVARPVGDDQLESTIEFTEGGGVTANGLPLK